VYVDADGDGYGVDGSKTLVCDAGAAHAAEGGDCDDANAATNPAAEEVCGDAVDDDCDGATTCRYSGDVPPADADARLVGWASLYLGIDVAPAGDTNGDGVGDVAVGTLGSGAFLFAGPVSGSLDAGKATAAITNTASGEVVGNDVQGIGDQDADGNDDLLIPSFQYLAFTGRVYIVLGPVTGTQTAGDAADATITGSAVGEYLGWDQAAGDVNGDGIVDLMLGAPVDGTGAAYVFFGPVTSDGLTSTNADVAFIGVSDGDFTGAANAANGDVDGDGIDDPLIGAERTDYVTSSDGALWLFYGPVSGEQSVDAADTVFYNAPTLTSLGKFTASGGDVDGDGLDDVVVSAPMGGDGNVYIVYGDSLSGASAFDVTTADGYISGDVGSGEQFGTYLDSAGDLDSDGVDDLAVSAASAAPGGMVFGFYGPVSGSLVATKDAAFTMTGDADQGVGSASVFVDDVTGDGVDDLAIGAYTTSIGAAYECGLVLLLNGTK
jgi:hypothetical protein